MFAEAPAGLINGVNVVYTLTYVPSAGSLQLFRNGVLQLENTDYTLSGATITFTGPPQVGDWLRAIYDISGGVGTVTSSLTATQIGDIANWVAITHLRRADYLPIAVEEALKFYRLMCTKVPFEILQRTGSEVGVTLNTAFHDLSAVDPSIAGIVSIRMTYSAGNSRRLKRSHVRLYDSLSTAPGRPYSYARWGSGIEFQPPPDSSSYTYRMRWWSRPTTDVLNPQNTLLVTPPEWDELVQWETLYRVYMNLEEYEKAQMLMQPAALPRQQSPKRTISFETGIIPRLWNDLLLTMSQRENVDEDFGINPVVRAYTSVRGG